MDTRMHSRAHTHTSNDTPTHMCLILHTNIGTRPICMIGSNPVMHTDAHTHAYRTLSGSLGWVGGTSPHPTDSHPSP